MGLRRFFSFLPVSVSFHLPIRIRRAGVLAEMRIEVSVRQDGGLAMNSRRAYAGALKRLNKWLRDEGCGLDDASLADYIKHLCDMGRTVATAAMVCKGVRRYCKVEGLSCPIGPRTQAAIKQFRRESVRRGRGQATPLLAEDAEAILDTAANRRQYKDGRRETVAHAWRRSLVDAALVAVLYLAGLRVVPKPRN